MKKVMCLSVAVANVDQSEDDISLNVQLAANFLSSLLKKNWQNIKVSERVNAPRLHRATNLCQAQPYNNALTLSLQ